MKDGGRRTGDHDARILDRGSAPSFRGTWGLSYLQRRQRSSLLGSYFLLRSFLLLLLAPLLLGFRLRLILPLLAFLLSRLCRNTTIDQLLDLSWGEESADRLRGSGIRSRRYGGLVVQVIAVIRVVFIR